MTPERFLPLLLCLAVTPAASLASQSTTFPISHTNLAGRGASTFFNESSARWMQISTEARGRPTLVRALAFRRGIGSGPSTGRNVTLTIRLGQGDLSKMSTTFASNWIGTPTTVLQQKKLVMPNWSITPQRLPAAFDFSPKLDRSYAFDGSNDLVLDMAQDARLDYSFTTPDTAIYRRDALHSGPWLRHGTSCPVLGRAYQTTAFVAVRGGTWGSLFLTTQNAPARTPTLMLLGASNPNLTVQGLCAKLLATPDIILSIGVSDRSGQASSIVGLGRYVLTPGSRFFAQAISIDTSRPVSPLVLSDGVMAYLPTAREPAVTMRSLIGGSSRATRASTRVDGGIVFRVN